MNIPLFPPRAAILVSSYQYTVCMLALLKTSFIISQSQGGKRPVSLNENWGTLPSNHSINIALGSFPRQIVKNLWIWNISLKYFAGFLKPSIQAGFQKSADAQLQLFNGPAKTCGTTIQPCQPSWVPSNLTRLPTFHSYSRKGPILKWGLDGFLLEKVPRG